MSTLEVATLELPDAPEITAIGEVDLATLSEVTVRTLDGLVIVSNPTGETVTVQPNSARRTFVSGDVPANSFGFWVGGYFIGTQASTEQARVTARAKNELGILADHIDYQAEYDAGIGS